MMLVILNAIIFVTHGIISKYVRHNIADIIYKDVIFIFFFIR